MRGRRGVSLVELLIAITVVAFIGAAMTRMLRMNSLATGRDDAAREARAVSRSALNLLESEFRAAEPAGVIAPTDDSTITLRSPYAFGVVCAIAGGTTLGLLPSGELPSSLVVPGKAGWAWRSATGTYIYELTTSLAAGAPGTCTAAGLTPLTSVGGQVVTTAAPTAGTPDIGTIGFLFREITYTLRGSTSAPGKRALFRTVSGGAAEELAAPFGEGARFRWFILNNTVAHDTLPTDLEDLRGVQFVFPGESRRIVQMTGQVAKTPFTTSVFFQNRPN